MVFPTPTLDSVEFQINPQWGHQINSKAKSRRGLDMKKVFLGRLSTSKAFSSKIFSKSLTKFLMRSWFNFRKREIGLETILILIYNQSWCLKFSNSFYRFFDCLQTFRQQFIFAPRKKWEMSKPTFLLAVKTYERLDSTSLHWLQQN